MRDTHARAIETAIRQAIGNDFLVGALTPVQGGSIHACYRVDGGGERYFAKVGGFACAPMFEAEADGLAALRDTHTFHVPKRLFCGQIDESACLILEHLDLQPLSERDHGLAAGEALARLHQVHGDAYGWPTDNYLGRTPQNNTPCPTWAAFLAERRLGPMIARAVEQGFDSLAKPGRALIQRIPALLVDHKPPAALLHGDLWHGNIGVLPDGTPAIFDPAVSHGDPEFDLAMTALFGGFPDSFYAAYRQRCPPAPGHDVRERLYRLYHVLNHLILFGRGYLGEAQRLVRWLLDCR